jgi:8-oxo-dGTP pyrophosphatase MutT (NUDIX family)
MNIHGERGAGEGGEYNRGPATRPRKAATVILLRGGDDALEVLLVQRTVKARFMGGVWVFPGGAVDDDDSVLEDSPSRVPGGGRDRNLSGGDPSARAPAAPSAQPAQARSIDAHALRRTATRELREEAGIILTDTNELVEFSRWITPAEVHTRFDTHFFLARLPHGQQPRVDGQECVAHGWFTPQAALAAHRAGEIVLVFPTIKHLEQLCSFPSVDVLLSQVSGRVVQPVQPRVVVDAGLARVLLPGEPGY